MQLHGKLGILRVDSQDAVFSSAVDNSLTVDVEQWSSDAAGRPDEGLSGHAHREPVVIINGTVERNGGPSLQHQCQHQSRVNHIYNVVVRMR